jgi:hypothetical protein
VSDCDDDVHRDECGRQETEREQFDGEIPEDEQ